MTTPEQPTPFDPASPQVSAAPPAVEAASMRPPAPRVGPLFVILALLVVGAGGAAYLLLRPQVAFTNNLAAPVRVVIGGAPAAVVAPGATVKLPASSRSMVVAEWELVRPISADSAPMGEEMRGSTVVRSPRGTVRAVAGTHAGDADYFAPLVTNATSQPLRVMVNAGLSGAMDCGCAVRAGGQRVFVGYYRLYQNSTVQVRGTSGATAAFKGLGRQVSNADGTVGLRFEDGDLRGGAPARRP